MCVYDFCLTAVCFGFLLSIHRCRHSYIYTLDTSQAICRCAILPSLLFGYKFFASDVNLLAVGHAATTRPIAAAQHGNGIRKEKEKKNNRKERIQPRMRLCTTGLSYCVNTYVWPEHAEIGYIIFAYIYLYGL